MKVNGSRSATSVAGSRKAPAAVAGGFAPDTAESTASAASPHAGALGAVGSLEALLALQEALGPLERRRRAVRRAGSMLDALDELKLEFVDGGDGGPALARLNAAVGEARERTDDAGLEDLLEQIEIRAAVELAKHDVAVRAA